VDHVHLVKYVLDSNAQTSVPQELHHVQLEHVEQFLMDVDQHCLVELAQMDFVSVEHVFLASP